MADKVCLPLPEKLERFGVPSIFVIARKPAVGELSTPEMNLRRRGRGRSAVLRRDRRWSVRKSDFSARLKRSRGTGVRPMAAHADVLVTVSVRHDSGQLGGNPALSSSLRRRPSPIGAASTSAGEVITCRHLQPYHLFGSGLSAEARPAPGVCARKAGC